MDKVKLNILDNLNSIYYGVEDYDPTIKKLTCKMLAEKLNVTPATISNLTMDSKFSLLYDISEEIFYYYQNYFYFKNDYNKRHPEGDGSYTVYSPMYILGYITGRF